MPAFETALDLGVTTLELDLHYTADQSVVIWHDDKVGKEKCGSLVKVEQNLAAVAVACGGAAYIIVTAMLRSRELGELTRR